VYLDELTDRDWLQSIWTALRRMEEALSVLPSLAQLPAPIVNVPPPSPPDLAAVVTAVESLHQPTARDIAMALADVLAPTRPDDSGDALREVAEALRLLEFRMQGIGQRVTVGGSSQVTFAPGTTMPVSGALTNTELRAAAVPVSGTVTVANPTTNPETGLAKDATLLRRYGDHVTKAGFANTPGDNTLHTPAAGKRIRLYWIALSSSQDNAAENLIQVKLTDADGTVKYRWRMGNPGAFAGSRTIDGNADELLVLNLANTNGIDWNVDLEEVT
jgi:hypothetical protein